MPRPSQNGLEWKETLFDLVPQWTRDISIAAVESVCRQRLNIPSGHPCTVAFLASGLLNKLYTVKCACAGGPLVMRVSLPVYPHHKTRAEVATLRWVRENTAVPVPRVFSFDDSNDNEIGYEWILMEFVQGTSAHRRWRTMSMEQKTTLTKQIATFQAELSGRGKPEAMFRGIGTLDRREIGQMGRIDDAGDADDADNTDNAEADKVVPGLLVSTEFFMGEHLYYDIPRGPFCSSHDWLSTQLNIILLHQKAVLDGTEDEDEDDREDAEAISSVARKLLSLLPQVFPPTSGETEITALYHDDLPLNNILVNEQGEITAVLGWECVSALPLWMFAQVPQFLDGPVREEEPLRDAYANQTPQEAATAAARRNDPDYLDNEGKNGLYFFHRREYETAQLRKVYESRLRELWPEWLLEESQVKMDLFEAISQCDGIWVKKVRRWADCMEKGEAIRFDDA